MIRSFVKKLRKALFPIQVKGDNNRYKCQSKIGPKFNIDVLGNNNSITSVPLNFYPRYFWKMSFVTC